MQIHTGLTLTWRHSLMPVSAAGLCPAIYLSLTLTSRPSMYSRSWQLRWMASRAGWKWHTEGIKLSASQLSAHPKNEIIRISSFRALLNVIWTKERLSTKSYCFISFSFGFKKKQKDIPQGVEATTASILLDTAGERNHGSGWPASSINNQW